MKLYGTPLSHFTRKVRLLLDHYQAEYELINIGNVAEGNMDTFAGNPLMKVPVLVDGKEWIVDSDNISAYIVNKLDPKDAFRVFAQDVKRKNIRAILNGIMLEEVKCILAKRKGVPVDQYEYFSDSLETISCGLKWLENHSECFDVNNPSYQEFHLISAWEHLTHYNLVPMEYLKLQEVVQAIASSPVIQKSSPHLL